MGNGCGAPSDSNGRFLTLLYELAMGRCPDSGGYAFWLGQLNSLQTKAYVAQSFIYSPEFPQLHKADLDAFLAARGYSPAPVATFPGSGMSTDSSYYVFRLDFYDFIGSSEISKVQVVLGPLNWSFSTSCAVQYVPTPGNATYTGTLSLLDSGGSVASSANIPTSGTLQSTGGRCQINCELSAMMGDSPKQ